MKTSIIIAVLLAIIHTSRAATVVYYRFEEEPMGCPPLAPIPSLTARKRAERDTHQFADLQQQRVGQSSIQSNNLSLLFNGISSRIFIPDYPQLHLTNSLTLEAFIEASSYPDSSITRITNNFSR